MTVGATTRLTRLITHDKITERLRAAFARADARARAAAAQWHPVTGQPITVSATQPGPRYSFVTCPWCVSVWAGLLLVGLYAVCPSSVRPALGYIYTALTASHVAGAVLTTGQTSGKEAGQ